MSPLLQSIVNFLHDNPLRVKKKYIGFCVGDDYYSPKKENPAAFCSRVFRVDVAIDPALGISWIQDSAKFVADILSLDVPGNPPVVNAADLKQILTITTDGSFFDYKTKFTGGYLVLDADTLLPSHFNTVGLRNLVGAEFYNEVLVPQAKVYHHVFDPITRPIWRSRPSPKYESEGIIEANAYVPPKIYTETPARPLKDIDIKAITAFLRYLFPNVAQRRWVFGWMAQATVSRSRVFLCLVGKEATGKTTFANLMKRLICGFDEYSQSYFFRGQKNFGKTNFTGHLEGKRLLFLDEFRLRDRDHLDVFKDIIEDDVNRESKFKEEKTIKNTISIIMANNWDNSLFIHPATGRKFSVPDIAEKKMTQVFSDEEILEIQAAIENPEVIAKLYHTLKHNYLQYYEPDKPIHGATYERVTRASSYSFITAILRDEIDEARKPDAEWEVADLVVDYMPGARGGVSWTEARVASEIVEFFQAFRQNGELACEVIYKKGKPWLKLTEAYFEFLSAQRLSTKHQEDDNESTHLN